MRTLTWHSRLAMLAVVLLLNALSAESEEARRVPVTDPAVLESMGLPADARNVFTLVGANQGETEAEGVSSPKYFGASSGFAAAPGVQFRGRTSVFAYNTSNAAGDIYNTNPAVENFADAQVDVPDGALLESARLWFSDENAAHDISMNFFESCQPLSAQGPPFMTSLGTVASSGSAGNGSLEVALGAVADPKRCVYFFRIRFGSAPFAGPGDFSLALQKARVQWLRQVAPAPAVATFPNDVPTTHPYFQFVEALASAGITSGIAPGTFGVDLPISRGEMAVFLAFALGLGFGN